MFRCFAPSTLGGQIVLMRSVSARKGTYITIPRRGGRPAFELDDQNAHKNARRLL
jgi:hypothetical protein